ncbi:MAG TPA: choice-of-anchor tandem repeat GloVer-containing protein [Candidatus Baltobacteraceae bacterium]|nr:choice-of-anchor tandem repeat GloVer-containing protein [Candidatus Baltobacteraceae bacterium]
MFHIRPTIVTIAALSSALALAGCSRGALITPPASGTAYSKAALPLATPGPPRNPNGLVAVGDTLYGTTYNGGTRARGNVFSITTAGKERNLYSFQIGAKSTAALIDVNGVLYGTTSKGGTGYGTAFGISASTYKLGLNYSFGAVPDASFPQAALIAYNGLLYGTSENGGTSDDGAVFVIDPASGKETVLYSFKSGTDGDSPASNLMLFNGKFYGTTMFGGSSSGVGNGTIYQLDPSTGAEKVVYSFTGGSDGAQPSSGLRALNGKLYGVTLHGNGGNYGVVFSFDPATGKEIALHAFGGGTSDGFLPNGNLAAIDGMLYGTTFAGGSTDNGTVFVANPATETAHVIYSFHGSTDGISPASGVIAHKGVLYGTTSAGGTNNNGTVFSLTTSGFEKTLHVF